VKLRLALFLALLGTFLAHATYAQEVIMNQPSADIVDKGHLFVRSDSFYTQSPAYFFQQANFAYGVAKNLEVSLNANDLAHGATVWAVIPGVKYALVNNQNFTFFVGTQYWKPVSNFQGYHNGVVTYEAAAFKFQGGKIRLTGGSYQSTNAYRLGNSAGAIVGVEYTAKMFKNGWMISPGVDWASGRGSNGYISPGLMFSKGSFFICPGYMIGNPHAIMGAHQSFVMIGKTFGRSAQ
jgi:hypothetical protein